MLYCSDKWRFSYEKVSLLEIVGGIGTNYVIKDNNKYYIPDISEGLRLSQHVSTKFSPAIHYPTLFLFSDTDNPDRNFVTGRCKEHIKWMFE